MGSKKIRLYIDDVHACPLKADEFTQDIVEGVANKINYSGIITIVSRMIADLNRPRNINNEEVVDEYRQTIRGILEHIGIETKDLGIEESEEVIQQQVEAFKEYKEKMWQ